MYHQERVKPNFQNAFFYTDTLKPYKFTVAFINIQKLGKYPLYNYLKYSTTYQQK